MDKFLKFHFKKINFIFILFINQYIFFKSKNEKNIINKYKNNK